MSHSDSDEFPTALVLLYLEGSDPTIVAARAIVRTSPPPYARKPGAEDWPRTRASLQLVMKHQRIDEMPTAVLADRVRLGLKL